MLVFSALALASCGGGSSSSSADYSDSKYVGTWKATSMSLKDVSEGIEDDWMLTLNADGTGELTADDETATFNWEPTKDGFKTTGDMRLTFTDDGDNIKAEILGVDLNFAKQ